MDTSDVILEQQSVRDYGIKDDDSLDMAATQAVLSGRADEGSEAYFPPGTYRNAPLRVGDDTVFRLANGAELRFVQDFTESPTVESRQEGWDQDGFHPCLHVVNTSNVAIISEGVIDDGSPYQWVFVPLLPEQYPSELAARLEEIRSGNQQSKVSIFTIRLLLLQIDGCENMTISGVTLRNSPFWNTHMVYSDDIMTYGALIQNPSDVPNGNGIDVDSSRFARVNDIHIGVGDDTVCLKSGKDGQGREVGRPTKNVVVTNCMVEHGHGGVVIGSETIGGMRHVTVTNCTFADTDHGIRIRSKRSRDGTIEDLRFDIIIVRRAAYPFVINGYHQTDIDSGPKPITGVTSNVRNADFHHIIAEEVESVAFLASLPGQQFEGILSTDVDTDAARPFDTPDLSPAMTRGYDQRRGVFCKSFDRISFKDVHVTVPDENETLLTMETSSAVVLDGFETGVGEGPAIEADGVENLRIGGCVVPSDGEPFTRVHGESDGGSSVLLAGNYSDIDEAAVSVQPETVER